MFFSPFQLLSQALDPRLFCLRSSTLSHFEAINREDTMKTPGKNLLNKNVLVWQNSSESEHYIVDLLFPSVRKGLWG